MAVYVEIVIGYQNMFLQLKGKEKGWLMIEISYDEFDFRRFQVCECRDRKR
jgi:hypothetical protein